MTSRSLAGLVLACLAALALPAVALGHAELIESDPADGRTVETTPYTLTATFDEELDPERSSIVVDDSAGNEVARGGVTDDDLAVMSAELPELEPGEYEVRWTAVTPDDQGVERGTFTFTVEPSATPSPTKTPTSNATPATPSPAPTTSAAPSATPTPTSGSDVLLALLLAAVGIGAVLVFVFLRGRR